MPYSYSRKSDAEIACARLYERRGNATNRYEVAPYELDENGDTVSWGVTHWYRPYDELEADWTLNGHMWTERPMEIVTQDLAA